MIKGYTQNKGAIFMDEFDDSIVKALNPYPRWEKWEIKRKYGKHSAIYIDVWKPYFCLLSLLPRVAIHPKAVCRIGDVVI